MGLTITSSLSWGPFGVFCCSVKCRLHMGILLCSWGCLPTSGVTLLQQVSIRWLTSVVITLCSLIAVLVNAISCLRLSRGPYLPVLCHWQKIEWPSCRELGCYFTSAKYLHLTCCGIIHFLFSQRFPPFLRKKKNHAAVIELPLIIYQT